MTELGILVERFRRESGFEVYVHALGREHDLNDGVMRWGSGFHVYVRAVHNLKRKYIGSDSSALPLDKTITHIPDQDRIRIEVSTALKFKNIREANPDFRYYPPIYLWMLGEESTTKDVGYEERPFVEHRKEPRKGPLKYIIPYKTVSVEVKKHVPVEVKRQIYIPLKLNEIIETQINDSAYAMLIQMPVTVYDSAGRSGGYPRLGIITKKDLIEQAATFLLMYPELYKAFIRGILPREEFPNVNRNILDLLQIERDGVVISNGTTGEVLRADIKKNS